MRRNVKFGEDEREFTRADQDINWFDEGKETLTRRVKQIQTGIHWAEEPVSRISHLVSNVQLLEAEPSVAEPREVTVKCRFLIYRNRVETETDILVGKREDLLRRDGDGLADRAAQDRPRPERAADQEPDVFLLRWTAMAMTRGDATDGGGIAPAWSIWRRGRSAARSSSTRRSTREELERRLRPRLAVCRPREPDPEPRRLSSSRRWARNR